MVKTIDIGVVLAYLSLIDDTALMQDARKVTKLVLAPCLARHLPLITNCVNAAIWCKYHVELRVAVLMTLQPLNANVDSRDKGFSK